MKTQTILAGIRAGRDFFKYLSILGKWLIMIMIVISVFVFWMVLYIFYEPFRVASFYMIQVLRLAVILFISGLFYLFLDFLANYIEKKQINKLANEEIYNVRKRSAKRKWKKTKFLPDTLSK